MSQENTSSAVEVVRDLALILGDICEQLGIDPDTTQMDMRREGVIVRTITVRAALSAALVVVNSPPVPSPVRDIPSTATPAMRAAMRNVEIDWFAAAEEQCLSDAELDWMYRSLLTALPSAVAGGTDEWRAMAYAPLDGTVVVLLIRHPTWWAAHKLNPSHAGNWQAVCEGHWIDHNGGGWTWSGLAGVPIGWRRLRKGAAP